MIEKIIGSILREKEDLWSYIFNIYVNNTIMDDEVSAFVDSMEALGLEQHCNFITHKACNTLDLVITETFSPLQVKACQAGDFISDHCIVQCWSQSQGMSSSIKL